MDAQRLRKSPNVAIVGSTSLLGKELHDVLDTRGLPVGRLALLETEEYAGLLQEFAGEIQITQVIAPSAFDDIDIAFFACSPEIMRSYMASGAKFPELLHPGDARWAYPTLADVQSAKLDQVKAIIAPALANGPIEITMS